MQTSLILFVRCRFECSGILGGRPPPCKTEGMSQHYTILSCREEFTN